MNGRQILKTHKANAAFATRQWREGQFELRKISIFAKNTKKIETSENKPKEFERIQVVNTTRQTSNPFRNAILNDG